MVFLHRCPSCRTHVGWQRIFFPRPSVTWACASCGAQLAWLDPPRRVTLTICALFAGVVVLAMLALSASPWDGPARLLTAVVLALVLGILCQASLARVGLASRP
jgi:uncharacterized protein (DUF983 family)